MTEYFNHPHRPSLYQDTIELLSVNLLDQNRNLVEELREIASVLRLEFGWHYLLDLTWTITNLGKVEGKRIIDAGAGTGVLQWYLASHGAEVISIDRLNRSNLPVRYRKCFNIRGMRQKDLIPVPHLLLNDLLGRNHPENGGVGRKKTSLSKNLTRFSRDFLDLVVPRSKMMKTRNHLVGFEDVINNSGNICGSVVIYNQDLNNLEDIPPNTIDAVASISALEHNDFDGLVSVIQELTRVLKPGSPIVATLTAAQEEDFWHTPSNGWCFTDNSLREAFNLPQTTPSNYHLYSKYLVKLRGCAELRDNLAEFYSKSDQNGMPWGIWDPQYMPVGVYKVKEK